MHVMGRDDFSNRYIDWDKLESSFLFRSESLEVTNLLQVQKIGNQKLKSLNQVKYLQHTLSSVSENRTL